MAIKEVDQLLLKVGKHKRLASVVGTGIAILGVAGCSSSPAATPTTKEVPPSSPTKISREAQGATTTATPRPSEAAGTPTTDKTAIAQILKNYNDIGKQLQDLGIITPTAVPGKTETPASNGKGTAPATSTVFPSPTATETPRSTVVPTQEQKANLTTSSDLLNLIPNFPELVKNDPLASKVPNRVPMWFAQGDESNPLNALRSKVEQFAKSKAWNIMGKPKEWFYPLPVKNGNGETGSDTWAYALDIIKSDNLSVYMKPGVVGQIWFRLPKGVTEGHMTVAFAVNSNFESDKTGGDPNVAPAVIIRNPVNPDIEPIPVNVIHAYPDGRRFSGSGSIPPQTDNVIVRLVREGAITMVDFPVKDPTGNQREGMIELGSDSFAGPFFNPDLNRIRVEDVKQVK